MSVVEVFTIIGVLGIGIGLIATWVKNGRTQARIRGSMEARIESMQREMTEVKDEIKNDDHGLVALKNDISGFKTHCAAVSTDLAVRVKSNEADIEDIRKERRKRK